MRILGRRQRGLVALAAAVLLVGVAAGSPAAGGEPEVAVGMAAHGNQWTGWLDPPVPLRIAAAFDAPESDWGAGHRGIDLWLESGADVAAPGDGIVTFAGRVAGRGVVVVAHTSGLRSTLEPVAATLERGATVRAGTTVGTLEVPGTHCAPKACLHWGVRRGDEYVDPLDVLRGYGPIRLLPLREWQRVSDSA